MAEGTIKNRIVIEGEAEYKKALAEINRALKESKSELKAVAAEYAASGNSAKGLTAQIATLEKTHAQQSEQLQLMQEHLGKVTAAYGENSREAVDLRTKINNARAEMAKTAGELTQLRTRLDAAGDAMDDLGNGTGGAENGLARIGQEAEQAQNKVGELGDELGGLSDLVPDLKGKLAGALTIGAIGKGISEAVSLANDELVAWQNLAAYTGETGDNLERLKNVSRTVYQAGYGESLMEVTTTVSQVYQQTGLMDEELTNCVKTAQTLSRVFGMDVKESTRAASALMQNFGIDAGTAYDLIVTGAQNGADKNGNLLDTINEYSPYFAASGKSADEFFAALIGGAQAGVYDVDKIGDAWKEFMLRITSGDDGAKEALKSLGFEATDLTHKIAAGGPAADLATTQIIEALARVEDPYKRNQLGVALFGTQWEDTGGRCLSVFADMEEGLGDVTGASEKLNKVTMSDFDTALEGTKRRVAALFAEFISPTAQQAANLLNGFNAMLDGEGTDGFWQAAAIDSGEQAKNIAERQRLMAEYGLDENEAFLAQIRGGDVGAALKYRDQVGFTEKIKSVVSGWFGGEDVTEAVASGAQSLAQSAAEQADTALEETMPSAGEYAVTYMTEGMEQSLPLAQEAGEELAQETIDAVLAAEPEAEDAGGVLVDGAVYGVSVGAQGMYDAGANAAQGAIDGARSGESAMYEAGAALGGAFRRGFQDKMLIKSPSRAAMEDMAYVTEGYLEQAERDRSRIMGGAAALADALREGFGRPELAMPEIASGGGGLSAGALAQAIREELDGMAFYLDAESMSVRLEPYVSRATSDRIAATAQGQSSRSKSW